MKKKLGILFLFITLLVSGCGKYDIKNIIKDLNKDLKSLESYYIEGEMELINNEDIYKYNVNVSYKSKDNYRVSLKNQANNHEQIILKNSDGVYVLTPSLNKSFKFESNWPYNNSEVYLIQSLVNDINNDKSVSFIEKEDTYVITSSVNYPNNRSLVKQEMYFDKKLNLKEVHVLNENGNVEIKMVYITFNKNVKFDDDHFDLKRNLEVTKTSENITTTSSIDDVIFPMYLPVNTTLSSQETINKTDGERIILTFGGDYPFVLIEETVSVSDDYEIIPTVGEPTFFMDTLGTISTNSLSWISGNMEYYIASSTLSNEEMLTVAKSISTIPVMK